MDGSTLKVEIKIMDLPEFQTWKSDIERILADLQAKVEVTAPKDELRSGQ